MTENSKNQTAGYTFDMFIVFEGNAINMRGVEYSLVAQDDETATIYFTPWGLQALKKNIARESVLDDYGWGAIRSMSAKRLAALEAQAMERDTLYPRIANELNGSITYNLNELCII